METTSCICCFYVAEYTDISTSHDAMYNKSPKNKSVMQRVNIQSIPSEVVS